MKTEQLIIILLTFITIFDLTLTISSGSLIPAWIEIGMFPRMFDITNLLNTLLWLISAGFVFIGVFKLIQNKSIAILLVFKFPILLFIANQLFQLIAFSLSTEFSYFILQTDAPILAYSLKGVKVLLAILICRHFWINQIQYSEVIQVSKTSRLWNWLIDITIIISICFSYVRILGQGFIFDHIEYFKDSPYWWIYLNMFCYFFVLELLFNQSIGKLHNGSFIHYKGNRVKVIFLRTICRFIPFEAFSFLGKKGWHDQLSQSEVVRKA